MTVNMSSEIENDAAEALSGFLQLEGFAWFGAFALVFVQELRVSIAPLWLAYGEEDVLRGETVCLPSSSIAPLHNAAFLHHEGFELARLVVGDLIYSGNEMPLEIRTLAKLMISGEFPRPPRKQKIQTDIPSSSLFLRDYAIWYTLMMLKNRHSLAPTSGGESKKLNGPEVVECALRKINASRSGENITHRSGATVKTINAVWAKRSLYMDLPAAVSAALAQCRHSINISKSGN